MRPNENSPAGLRPLTSSRGFTETARNYHELRTSLGTLSVVTEHGRFGWTASGDRSWVAQLLTDDVRLDEVGDAFAVTEREALAVLSRAVRRYGDVAPAALPASRAGKWFRALAA